MSDFVVTKIRCRYLQDLC